MANVGDVITSGLDLAGDLLGAQAQSQAATAQAQAQAAAAAAAAQAEAQTTQRTVLYVGAGVVGLGLLVALARRS